MFCLFFGFCLPFVVKHLRLVPFSENGESNGITFPLLPNIAIEPLYAQNIAPLAHDTAMHIITEVERDDIVLKDDLTAFTIVPNDGVILNLTGSS